nr:hypothetical protein [Tanacetum cinerariifolium]
LLHLAVSQPMLKSSYKAEASIIISIPPLVGGVADVVVEIKVWTCEKSGTMNLSVRTSLDYFAGASHSMIPMLKKTKKRTKIGSKPDKKREACRSREKFKAVAVERGRKNEENKKRMAENAYTYQKLLNFKERKKRKGQKCKFMKVQPQGPNLPNLKSSGAKDEPSISTWEDLTTQFLAQFFLSGRTAKLHNDILITEESWAFLEYLALYENKSWNDLREFAKPVKAVSLPQYVPSTSDHRLLELKHQVQHLMEAYIARMQPTQVNKITSSCKICNGPHDTQYCMENPEQALVEYASSRIDEARGKWYTFKHEQNNLGDTYNPSRKSHPNLRWRWKRILKKRTKTKPKTTKLKQKNGENTT